MLKMGKPHGKGDCAVETRFMAGLSESLVARVGKLGRW